MTHDVLILTLHDLITNLVITQGLYLEQKVNGMLPECYMLQFDTAISQTQPLSPVAVTPPQDSDEEPEENAFGIICHSGSRPAKRKCLQVAAALCFRNCSPPSEPSFVQWVSKE